MWKRCIAGGTLLASLGLGAVAAPAISAASTAAAPCPGGTSASDVQGKPAAIDASATGMAVWLDGDVWRVRVHHAGNDKAVFRGKIRTPGQIYGVGRHLEQGGEGVLNTKTHVVLYRFTNYGALDGLDFKMRCAVTVTIGVQLAGKSLSPDQVYIGSAGKHPGSVPFTLTVP